MSFTKEQLREQMLLYAVTDRLWLNGQTLYEQVEEALKGGATFIQLREKDLTEEEHAQRAELRIKFKNLSSELSGTAKEKFEDIEWRRKSNDQN